MAFRRFDSCPVPRRAAHFTRRMKLSFKPFFPLASSNLYIKKWTLILPANRRGLAAALHHARSFCRVPKVFEGSFGPKVPKALNPQCVDRDERTLESWRDV